MADVFISYASAEPDGPKSISKALVRAGYSVWWDDQLLAGERFRASIIRELTAARVAIVIWTRASVASDWVYSEARRASDQQKLVQLRSRDLAIDDLPAPFDAFHCPFVDDEDSMLRAVAGLLGRDASVASEPPVPPETSGNLPPGRGAIVGRDGELFELEQYLHSGERLITLTGAGGSGKTRLAVEVARRSVEHFSDGAFLIPLAPVTDVDAAWPAVARALSLKGEHQDRATVLAWLQRREVLLVLDNLEQMQDVDTLVDELLDAGSGVSVLATSRRPLHVDGEREHRVPPLLLPQDASFESIQASGAVQLFVRYAQRVQRGFVLDSTNARDVAALCEALDGLPLAIELVASRAKVASPALLLARLEDFLDVRGGGADRERRQSTMRETIAWSLHLLPDRQQQVLAYLGVFAGGADTAAIEAVLRSLGVSDADVLGVLSDLVDVSLVNVTEIRSDETRFHLLETIRQFAIDQLATRGEKPAARDAHSKYFYDRAKALFARRNTSYTTARESFVRDIDNFREAAMTSGAIRDDDLPTGAASALLARSVLARTANAMRHYVDARAWLTAALELAEEDDAGRLACLARLCYTHVQTADPLAAIEVGRVALQIAAPLVAGPPTTSADATWDHPHRSYCYVNYQLAIAYLDVQQLEEARQAAELAVDASAWVDEDLRATALAGLVHVAVTEGDWARAAEVLLDIQALTSVKDLWGQAWLEVMTSLVELHQGQALAAQARVRDGLHLFDETGDPELITSAAEVLAIAVGRSRPELCARCIGAVVSYREKHGVSLIASEARLLQEDLANIKAPVAAEDWNRWLGEGATIDLLDIMKELAEAAV